MVGHVELPTNVTEGTPLADGPELPHPATAKRIPRAGASGTRNLCTVPLYQPIGSLHVCPRSRVGWMRLIGLTGGIATGKSTVARMLHERGATVIDADELARQAVRPGTPALDEIVARFGDHVIDAGGELDRAAMADIVFADTAARLDLERITHPRVLELMQQQIADAFARDAPVVVVDVPLLFETGRDDMFEGVLLVHAPAETQVRRLRDRDGLRDAAALQRLDAQLPIDEKRSRATWVIENADSLADTERQVAAWWDEVVGNSC